MNILVFSDSHGNRKNIDEVISRQIKKPDAIIFLGDGIRDMIYSEQGGIMTYSVVGNCDFGIYATEWNIPDEQMFFLGDKKFLITHGHKYDVKNSLVRLIRMAIENDVDILLFGHTHICMEKTVLPENNEYGLELNKPLHIMNPGSIGHYPNSWGCIDVDHRGNILMSHGALL